MTTKKQRPKARFTLMIGAIIILTIIGTLFGWVSSPLLIKAGSTLPPRVPPTPGAPAGADNDGGNGGRDATGAYIELRVRPAQKPIWSVVRWQDSTGGWQKVEGWQGTLDTNDNKRWWVAPRDFGTGPFRWEIYQGQEGQLLGTSESFYLPVAANEIVRINMSSSP